MKLISVIIPIYNTQKYLKKCIDSVESQSYNNIEIILVNDGSTDSSEKIIQPYLQKYENIKYYKKENGGLSDARNYGIQKATGDYICFLDSDDYIDVNLFSKLQKYLDLDYDMIKYKLVKVDENYNETEKVDGPIFEEKTGEEAFKYNKSIRYGLSAIKSIGKPVIDAIVWERNQNGNYRNFRDFVERLSGKELNKRTIENFIKAGALDGLCDNRKQLMMIYVQVVDSVNQEKKNAMAGQMSLFDFVAEEDKKDFEIRMPDVEEYDKEQLLAFEKEVLGVYISGHPLEKYEKMWQKNMHLEWADLLQKRQKTCLRSVFMASE